MNNKNKVVIILLLSSILIVLSTVVAQVKGAQKSVGNKLSEIQEDQSTELENKEMILIMKKYLIVLRI